MVDGPAVPSRYGGFLLLHLPKRCQCIDLHDLFVTHVYVLGNSASKTQYADNIVYPCLLYFRSLTLNNAFDKTADCSLVPPGFILYQGYDSQGADVANTAELGDELVGTLPSAQLIQVLSNACRKAGPGCKAFSTITGKRRC